MLTIKIGNACWQLKKYISGGDVFMFLDSKAPCFTCIIEIVLFQFSKVLLPCIPYLGVIEYPWEIIVVDFIIGFIKSSKLYFATIFESCLPFDKDVTLSFVS